MKISEKQTGILCAFGAFGLWGVLPVYFKALHDVEPIEFLAHRIWWSFVFLLVLLFLMKKFAEVKRVFSDKKLLLILAFTAVLIAANWGTYIAAVMSGNIAEASLGYFINPLINILFGILFLKERASILEKIAIAIAIVAITLEMINLGKIPLIALSLALTFGFYGIIRKKTDVASFTGLFVETTILTPIALGYIAYLVFVGANGVTSLSQLPLIVLSGPITVVPLVLFTAAAARIRLGTLGFIQYLSPSVTFSLALFVYNEHVSQQRFITFALIWISLVFVVADTILRSRKKV